MKAGTDLGYDVNHGSLQKQDKGFNGWLYYKDDNGGPKISAGNVLRIPETVKGTGGKASTKFNGRKLWVYEVQTGFSLSGTTGQSISTRSFFPRNRVQQSISIFCQCPGQEDYADTVEWIHRSQKSRSSSVRMVIKTKNMPVKGLSQPLFCEGYIKSVPRSHRRFEYAPELQFDFLVEAIFLPAAWNDRQPNENVSPRILPSWKDVIERDGVFRRDPDAVDKEPPTQPPDWTQEDRPT